MVGLLELVGYSEDAADRKRKVKTSSHGESNPWLELPVQI